MGRGCCCGASGGAFLRARADSGRGSCGVVVDFRVLAGDHRRPGGGCVFIVLEMSGFRNILKHCIQDLFPRPIHLCFTRSRGVELKE